jgi:predicted peptidase
VPVTTAIRRLIGAVLYAIARLHLHGTVLPMLARIGRRLRGEHRRQGDTGERHTDMNASGLQITEDYPLKCVVRPAASAPPGTPRALLCFLHGYDEAAPLDVVTALTRHGPLRPGNPARYIDQFVIVAPQLPTAGDNWIRYARVVQQIALEEARRNECDLGRLYLTGFSFGGNGVFDLALEQPELWAALWAVDPTRVPLRKTDVPTWLSLGEVSRYQASGFIRRLQLEPAERLVTNERVSGDRVWFDEGHDHVGAATFAYRDARIYEWLLSKSRSSARPDPQAQA